MTFNAEYTLPPGPRIADIRAVVCRHFEVSEQDIRSRTRVIRIARPRQIAMYLAKRLTIRSLNEIGSQFGITDHTTVKHAHDRVHALRKEDPELNDAIRAIAAELKG